MAVPYSGIWKPGSSEQTVFTNASWPNFTAKADALRAQGLQLTSISTDGHGDARRWTGVFTQQPGTETTLAGGLTIDQFKAKRTDLSGAGMRLRCIESYVEKGEVLLTAVWFKDQQPPPADGFWLNAPWEEFKQTVKKAREEHGLRLVDFSTHDADDGRRWCGVWNAGSDEALLWVGGDLETLRGHLQTQGARGLEPVRLKTYWDDGRTRYAALWRTRSEKHVVHTNLTLDQLRDRRQELRGQMELIDLTTRSDQTELPRGPRLTLLPVVLAAANRFSDQRIQQMIDNVQRALGQPDVGISTIVKDLVRINNPALQHIRLLRCVTNTALSQQHRQLFDLRPGADAKDIVAYFVDTAIDDIGHLNGCATHPGGLPGLLIATQASPWTLAHELVHVLGRTGHSSSPSDLMFNSTNSIVGNPPRLLRHEVVKILASPFLALLQ